MPRLWEPYKIRSGDTLWEIAKEKLGSGTQWPRIYAFNNSREALKAGAKRISNPDTIKAGDTILIPNLNECQKKIPTKKEPSRPPSLKAEIKSTKVPFSVQHQLDLQPPIVLNFITFIATIKLSGSVVITLGRPVPLTYVTDKSIEASAQKEVNAVYAKLISESSVNYKPSGEVSFSNRMIVESKGIGAPKTAFAVEVGSARPVPILKAEIIYPELRGKIGNDAFCTTEVKITIEIEPVVQPPRLSPVRVHQTRPVPASTRQNIDWARLAADARPATQAVAAVVTVGFVAWCFVTYGAGAATAPAYTGAMAGLLLAGVQ